MNVPTIYHYLALGLGLMTLAIGIGAVLKPEFSSKQFGIKVSGSALPYVVSTGIRDLFMSCCIFGLFYLEAWKALGLVIASLFVVAITDFILVRKHGDKRISWLHFVGAVGSLVYGLWMYTA